MTVPTDHRLETSESTTTPGQDRATRAIHWPTVAMSAGCSALAASAVLALAMGGYFGAARVAGSEPAPNVVTLGGAATSTNSPAGDLRDSSRTRGATTPRVTASTPRPSAPASRPPAVAPGAASALAPEAAPGPSAGVPAPEAAPPPADAPEPEAAPLEQPEAAKPTVPGAGELDARMRGLLNPGAGDALLAQSAEGGQAAVPTLRAVISALGAAGPVYRWRIDGPVSADGDTLHATLTTSLVGWADRTAPISWVWRDGDWRLSNASVCALAANAMAPCSV